MHEKWVDTSDFFLLRDLYIFLCVWVPEYLSMHHSVWLGSLETRRTSDPMRLELQSYHVGAGNQIQVLPTPPGRAASALNQCVSSPPSLLSSHLWSAFIS